MIVLAGSRDAGENRQTRFWSVLLAVIRRYKCRKGSPESMNDSSWVIERYRCWLVIDGELLCILQWLMGTKETAASGTWSRHIGHFYDSAKSCGNARLNCACALERLNSAVVFTKNWRDTNIGNITKGISVTGRTCKIGTPKKLRTVHKRSEEA